MQVCPVSVVPNSTRMRPRTALVASADSSFRQRLNEILTGLRWQVREASGGADAWTQAAAAVPEAVIVDSWLPDLSCTEFLKESGILFPEWSCLVRTERCRRTGRMDLIGRNCSTRCDAVRRSMDPRGRWLPTSPGSAGDTCYISRAS